MIRTIALRGFILGVFSLAGAFTHPATGADFRWDGDGNVPPDGRFQDALNWDRDAVPQIGDTAIFEIGDTYTVQFPSDADTDALQVLRGDVTFESSTSAVQTYDVTTSQADLTVRSATFTIGQDGAPVVLNIGDELIIGQSVGTAVVFVAGERSRLDALNIGSVHTLGAGGQVGALSFETEAEGDIRGALVLGSGDGSHGSLSAGGDSHVTLGSLSIATETTTATGQLSLVGADSTISQSGGSTLEVGSASGGAGTLSVLGGRYDTGSGNVTVGETGQIDVLGGIFNANGDVSVDGGGVEVSSNATFNLAAGRTLTASGGGALVQFDGDFSVDANRTFTFESGADLMLGGDLNIGTSGDPGAATLETTFSQSSDITMTGDSTLTIGHTSAGTATLDVDGGVLTTGTGGVTIQPTGTLFVGSGSGDELVANGDVLVDGGNLVFDFFQGGGLFTLGAGLTVTLTNDALLDSERAINISQDQTYVVEGGSHLTTDSSLTIGDGTDGTLVVDGAQSLVSQTDFPSANATWGRDGGRADVTIRDNAIVSIDRLSLANFSPLPGTSAVVRIESDGVLITDELLLATNGGATTVAEITVTGEGSRLSVRSGQPVTLGHASEGSATINVLTGGTFFVGPDSPLTLRATGALNILGGTLSLNGPLVDEGGALNFIAGTVSVPEDFAIGAAGLFGDSLTLESNRNLTVGGATMIEGGAVLNLQGGRFTTGSLAGPGIFDFQLGTFALTEDNLTVGAGGLFGEVVVLPTGKHIDVTNTVNVVAGAQVVVQGGSLTAGLIDNNGQITLAGATAALAGGTLRNDHLVHGHGRVDAELDNRFNGEVRVAAGDTLTFTAANNNNFGEIRVLGGTVAFEGPLENIGGVIHGRGVLIADGGLTNRSSAEMNFSGGPTEVFGPVTIEAGSTVRSFGAGVTTFFHDVQQDGDVIASGTSIVAFLGSVTGSGNYPGAGVIEFRDGVSLGASPAAISFGGDVIFGGNSDLTIELEGTSADDAEFDQLLVSANVSLDGALNVAFTGDFHPAPGDSFKIISAAGGVSGAFDAILAPGLDPLLDIGVFYEPNAMTLAVVPALPGDYNFDGVVNAADYAVWRNTLGHSGPGLAADGSGTASGVPDGVVDQLDYQFWVDQFGNSLGSASLFNTAVPEPATFVLLVWAAAFRLRQLRIRRIGPASR